MERLIALKHVFTRGRLAPVTRRALRILDFVARANPVQSRKRRVRELRFLNVGCGKKPIAHMINLNYEWYPHVDLTWDILKPLPLRPNQLEGIFSEHVLEHLPYDRIPDILKDWHRVLRPGGSVRILVPDAELYLNTYVRAKNREPVVFPYHESAATPMMIVNRVFRGYDHLYAYDFETMKRLLEQSGFTSVQHCSHRRGATPELLVDSEDRECESLRIEARK
jgi:predicted SAM-dependent methyltransferase